MVSTGAGNGRGRGRRRLGAFAGVALFVLAAGCGGESAGDPFAASGGVPASAPASPSPPPPLTGADACLRCHMVRGWEGSLHPRSARPAGRDSLPAQVLGGESVSHPPGATAFAAGGDGWTATTVAGDGAAAAFPVDLVVGAARMTMLVTKLPDGRLQVLPSMREEPDGPWFDYTHLLYGGPGDTSIPRVLPGEPSFWTGPDRSYEARCARCHSSGYEPLDPGPAGGPRSRVRAHGVDCEACHGDGEGHSARFHGLPGAPAADPLPRLAALDRDASLGVCLQCHMEGEPVKRGFRPGDDFLEFADPTLLDAAHRVDPEGRPRELIYEGLSFLASACAGAGGLTCLDCHGPHAERNRSQLRLPPDRLGEVCARCHSGIAADAGGHARHRAPGAGSDCVACHMPPVTIERGHGSVHDHSISIPRPPPAGPGPPPRDACNGCHSGARGFPPGAPPLDPNAVRAAWEAGWPGVAPPRPWTAALAAGLAGEPGAPATLVAVLRDRRQPRVVRASAARVLERYAEEASADLLSAAADGDGLVRRGALASLASLEGPEADHALLRALEDPSLAVRGAAARAALSGWRRVRGNPSLLAAVLPVLEEEAAAVPGDHMRWFRLGAARQIAGDDAGALEAYDRKLALDPGARLVREQAERLRARTAKGGR